MEKYVRVHDHKSASKQVARQPQRIQAIRLGVDRVLHILDFRAADAANALRLKTDYDRNFGYPAGPQIAALALDQGHSAQFNQALYGFAGNRLKTRAFASSKYDRPQMSPR